MNETTYVYKPLTGGPDGMLWDAANAMWAPESSLTFGDDLPPAVTASSLEQMIEMLVSMGFPLGELAGPDDLVRQFEEAVAARLDAFAREKQYDNMDKARLASQAPGFEDDGNHANETYSRVWLAAFPLIDQIRAGALTVNGALAQLPAMTWPAA